ncbi:MAG TPA: helix-turn-helix transcriptional regulator, partial [Opitutaceae bacterium]
HHWSQLTPREREVLGWVARAKTNPEIARILEMKVRTVEKHMENILAKLALENRASAMLAAIEAGLDTPVS